MKESIYFDKQLKNASEINRAFLFGEGVFETFRYKEKLPVFFDRHLARLKHSAEFLLLKYPGDFYIQNLVETFVKGHHSKDLVIKIALLGSGEGVYFGKSTKTIVMVSIKEDDSVKNEISLTIAQATRNCSHDLVKHKTTNYLISVLERRSAIKKGFDDALFLNPDNLVSETTSGNIFWIKGSNLFTPSLSCGLLPGITRSLIIDISNEKGLNILEGKYELGSILFPEAIFITNATKGIIEVVNIDNLIRPTRTQKIFPIIKNALYKALNWA